jgi:diphosphomevalonate decarboxylase
LIEKDFIFKAPVGFELLTKGSVTWQSPSNIALIKYWGKTEPQVPKNASLSFTLSNCHTTTRLDYRLKERLSSGYDFKVFFEGDENQEFKPKINHFFERIEPYVPFITAYEFEIHTQNSFPHSSGIASSASGMSALALCLMSIEKKITPEISADHFLKKASFLARLGSGSAARSIEGPLVVWGTHPQIKGSNNEYGIKYPYEYHPVFKSFQDTILLVDRGVKQVSSTVGHNLMKGHPYAEARFNQAREHMTRLITVLKEGDLNAFIEIVEREALSLHAMMMSSDPYFILMKPNTLEIIERIWDFRKKTKTQLCFTLDAGANVHVLYPEKNKVIVNSFITKELIPFCEKEQYIFDKAGNGALLL